MWLSAKLNQMHELVNKGEIFNYGYQIAQSNTYSYISFAIGFDHSIRNIKSMLNMRILSGEIYSHIVSICARQKI